MEIDNEVGESHGACFNFLAQFNNLTNGHRAAGECFSTLTNTILNSFCQGDLIFAGEQVNRSHLSHIHSNGISSSPKIILYCSCQRCFCLLTGLFII